MAVSFHKRPGRGRSSAGQVRRYQPAGQDAAQVRPYGHRSGQQHRRGGTEPAPRSETRSLSNGSPPPHPAGTRNGGVWSPRPTGATLVVPSSGPMWASAPTDRRGSFSNHPGQRRTAKRLRRGWEEWVGIGAEIIPQSVQQHRTIPQSALRLTAPFAQGSLGDGGCGLPRRFAPRNDSPKPLSFRGGPTGRRGNPSFLRWTGVRAAEVVGPYGRSTEVPATGRRT